MSRSGYGKDKPMDGLDLAKSINEDFYFIDINMLTNSLILITMPYNNGHPLIYSRSLTYGSRERELVCPDVLLTNDD